MTSIKQATSTPCAEAHPQAVFDVFVTAIEGGINYWAEVVEYKWKLPGGGEGLEGFHALVIDAEGDPEDGIRYTIDARVIRLGIARAVEAIREGKGAVAYQRAAILALAAGIDPDTGDLDYDADTADAIVQYGLLGEVVYA